MCVGVCGLTLTRAETRTAVALTASGHHMVGIRIYIYIYWHLESLYLYSHQDSVYLYLSSVSSPIYIELTVPIQIQYICIPLQSVRLSILTSRFYIYLHMSRPYFGFLMNRASTRADVNHFIAKWRITVFFTCFWPDLFRHSAAFNDNGHWLTSLDVSR